MTTARWSLCAKELTHVIRHLWAIQLIVGPTQILESRALKLFYTNCVTPTVLHQLPLIVQCTRITTQAKPVRTGHAMPTASHNGQTVTSELEPNKSLRLTVITQS